MSLITNDIIRDLKFLEDIFDFSNLAKSHELFSNKNKKAIGKFKIETPRNNWIDEFVCLRRRMYAFKCKSDSKKKIKGISKSQSEHNRFEEYKKYLDGEEYEEEYDKYILRSVNLEMYLRRLRKSTLSLFDDKRCYTNETESEPWNNYL